MANTRWTCRQAVHGRGRVPDEHLASLACRDIRAGGRREPDFPDAPAHRRAAKTAASAIGVHAGLPRLTHPHDGPVIRRRGHRRLGTAAAAELQTPL